MAGHASAGNLHFMLTPDFAKPEDRERYEAFMDELVELIVDKYDGSLKAEHGTGVNMAPWVEREWGEKATEMMWRVKRLADRDGVLNPGVVLNRDPEVHLRNLKTQPLIEEVAAHCVECGFCEPVCPSRNVTTTPRQRIVLRREMARQPEGSPVYEALLARVRVRRASRPAPPTAPAGRLPGGDRHRQADQGVPRARERTRARGGGGARARPALGGRRARAHAPGCAPGRALGDRARGRRGARARCARA